MAGPWDKYAQDTQNVPQDTSGPWAKFAKSPAAPAQAQPQYAPEQEADIPYKNRFVAKNFSTSPEASVEYLKKQLPHMEFSVKDGEIFARKPGEQAYKAMDPATGFFSKDFLKDTGDVAFDIGKGIAQSAATAGGTALGGMPGAIAAGSASGAGLEALRQKLGQALGIPQQMDTNQIKTEAAFGAALGPMEAGGKAAAGFVKNKFLPKLGEMTSGVPAKVLQDFSTNAERVKFLSEHPEELSKLVKDAKERIMTGVQNQVTRTGQAIGAVVDKATQEGKYVDISGIKAALEKRIAEAEKAAADLKNKDALRPLENLQSIKENFFMTPEGQELPNVVTPTAAFNLKQQLKTLAQPDLGPSAVKKIKDPADKKAMLFGQEAMSKTTEALNKVDEQLPMLNKNYKYLSEDADMILKKVGSDEKAENVFRNLDSSSKRTLQRKLSQVLSPEDSAKLKDDLQILQTQSYMGNPSANQLSGLGSTSTTRTVPLQTAGAGVGSYLGYKLGNSPGSALLGGALGAKTGAFLGSPKAIGGGLKTLNAIESGASQIPGGRAGLYGAGQSAWDALQQKYLQEKQ